VATSSRRVRVYIAGPLSSGDLCDNVNAATDCFHRLLKAGLSPFCPHWSVFAEGCHRDRNWDGYFNGSVLAYAEAAPRDTTWADWMAVDLAWVVVADAVLRLPGPSKGADAEVAAAVAAGVPVFTDERSLLEWTAAAAPVSV
jgi:hypothetical protein